ncbi:PP2C family protein-serine/threonine phosphatase [Yoonia maricola]|nr:protein phosphatase 2C domain-containing protein [Yoonia maricola]
MSKAFAFQLRQSKDEDANSRPKVAIKDRFDTSTIIDIGRRPYQQDAMVANFTSGDDVGIGVLADGMGGHLGGEVASNIAASAAFAEIKTQLISCKLDDEGIANALNNAIDRANDVIGTYVENDAQLRGMGTTLVVMLTIGPNLYWASVGDSPLYLCRGGKVQRLNQDHSMAPQIDAMVASGMMDEADGKSHPQRNELTSAVCGRAIAHRDCPKTSTQLQAGDILILSSDGLQTISDLEIGAIAHRKRRSDSADIAGSLMKAVLGANVEEQDNVSIMVVKINADDPAAEVPERRDAPLLTSTSGQAAAKMGDPDIEDASDLLNKALLL